MNRKDPPHTMIEALTQGVASLFGFMSALEKAGRQLSEGRAQHGDVKIDYRVATRTMEGGEDRGDSAPQPPKAQPVVREPFEMLVDVFDESGEVIVVAELPGVQAQDIRCNIDGDILLLDVGSADTGCRREVLLPVAVATDEPPAWTFRNGVLEIRLKTAADDERASHDRPSDGRAHRGVRRRGATVGGGDHPNESPERPRRKAAGGNPAAGAHRDVPGGDATPRR